MGGDLGADCFDRLSATRAQIAVTANSPNNVSTSSLIGPILGVLPPARKEAYRATHAVTALGPSV
jgi:hypothetical protein